MRTRVEAAIASTPTPSVELVEQEPTLGQALSEVAEAGKELATDRLELLRLQVTDGLRGAAGSGARWGAAAVLLLKAWGLLAAAAVVALSPLVGVPAALALVALPHLIAGAALVALQLRGGDA